MTFDLSAAHVAALIAIEAHGRLYCFNGLYQARASATITYGGSLVDDLVARGLARTSRVHVRCASHSVTITNLGQERLLAGPRVGAA